MRKMRKWLRRLAFVFAAALLAAQFVRPARTNPQAGGSEAFSSHARMSPEVEQIVGRACADCHTNRTRWPWYSNVAPVSWFVIDHVDHGRRHLNFSAWERYESRAAEGLLGAICAEAKRGRMPLKSYTLLHRDAPLSEHDVQVICEWTNTEATRLAAERRARTDAE